MYMYNIIITYSSARQFLLMVHVHISDKAEIHQVLQMWDPGPREMCYLLHEDGAM